MTAIPRPDVPVRSTPALPRRWRELLGPPLFPVRSLWLVWLGPDGRMLDLVMPLDDVPAVPDRRVTAGIVALHDAVAATRPGRAAHLALCLCRPGGPAATGADDGWSAELRDVLDEQLDATWSLHLAADGEARPLVQPPDRMWAEAS
ncbi:MULTISPECIES: hypothetical protein [unclassified Blastococcus]